MGRASSASAASRSAHTRLGAAHRCLRSRRCPSAVRTRHHPRGKALHPLRPALVEGHRQRILRALMVQKLPTKRQAGAAARSAAGCATACGRPAEPAEGNLATGLAPRGSRPPTQADRGPRPRRRRGRTAGRLRRSRRQVRGDGRVGGGRGRYAVAAAIDGGDGVARQVAASGEPAGLVQDPQRGAPSRQVQLHPRVVGVGCFASVEVEQGQRRPRGRVVTVRPGRRVNRGRGESPGVQVAARGREDSRGLGRDRRSPCPATTAACPAAATASSKPQCPSQGDGAAGAAGPRGAGHPRAVGAQRRSAATSPARRARRSSRARSAASTAAATPASAAGQRGRTVVLDSDLRRSDPSIPRCARRRGPRPEVAMQANRRDGIELLVRRRGGSTRA